MENVVNDLLNFNGLKIVQCNQYFNFSLDSVLLAHFVEITPRVRKIVDFGCGNAPIPMILSLKAGEKVSITGIEVQKKIYELAMETLRINNLSQRISLINDDVKNVDKYFNTDTFDIVVCNPPYFKMSEGSIVNDNDVKSIARHEIMLNILDVAKISKKILKNKGSLYLVQRTDRFIEIIDILIKNNLEPKRVRFVYPKEKSRSNLFLLEAVKNGKSMLKVEPALVVHNEDGQYREEVLEMFGGNYGTEKL